MATPGLYEGTRVRLVFPSSASSSFFVSSSREEWEWLQNLAGIEEPIPAEPDLETTPQNLLLQELQGAVKELMQLVNIPLHEVGSG